MIKLGLYASVKGKDDPPQLTDVETWVEYAYELRMDAVELHLGKSFLSREPDYLRRVKMLCLKRGLPIGYLGAQGNFSGSDEELDAKVEQAKADVDVAAFLGAPLVRLFGARVPEGTHDREPLWPPMVRCFQEVCDHAADKGVFVGLQNHDSGNLAATSEDVLRILGEVDRDNFTLILDTGQWAGSVGSNYEGIGDPGVDIYKYIAEAAPHASYVRAKIFKIDSGREEWLDYDRVVRILRDIGYNGTMSVVFEGVWHNQCDDKESLRLGAKHLREVLAANPE